jgi:hypothetical protein
MRRLLQVLLCGLFVVAMSSSVRAELIGPQHVGSTDPIDTEGWNRVGSGFGTGIDDGGTAAVEIEKASCNYYHNLTTAEQAALDSSAWVASASVNIPDAMDPLPANRSAVYLELSYGTGAAAKSWAISIGSHVGDGTPQVCQFLNLEMSVNNDAAYNAILPYAISGNGFHVFEMKRENLLSTNVHVYVDGTYEATIAPATGAATEDLNRFVWGNYGSVLADARWSAVSLNTIPEPSSLVLVTISSLALLAYAWRRRR